MQPLRQQKQRSHAKIREESDISLEVVILLIFGVFMFLFGVILLRIHTGALPYTPDSMYGLFLVLVSIQTITMGKTPFGDLRRSWMVIIIGTGTAVVGVTACFIPGPLTGFIRILVGLLLAVGGAALLYQLFFSEDKARTWMKIPGILRHLTLAAGLVYVLSVLLGLVALLPGITTNPQTAVLLIIYGVSFFYLAWSIQEVGRRYPPEIPGTPDHACPKSGFSFCRETSLPLLHTLIILMAVLLTLLGFLLFPVNLGLLPFSPDGQLGVLLTIMAIQMMTMGATPLGQYKRSWLMILIGIGFAALGVFSCIVPGILTGTIRILLGFLNITGGGLHLIMRFLSKLHGKRSPEDEVVAAPHILKKMMVTQTMLNIVELAFGLSMFLPGLIPGQVIAAILVINGFLLFALVSILQKLDELTREENLQNT